MTPEKQEAMSNVMPVAVAWLYPDGRPCTLSWSGQDEARMHEMAAAHGLIRQELFAHQPASNGTPLSLAALDLRTINCLLAEGIRTIEETQAMTDRELLNIPGFGRVCLARLRAVKP